MMSNPMREPGMRVSTLFPSTLGLLVLASSAVAAPPLDLERRAQSFIDAVNRQDAAAAVAAVSDDFRWQTLFGESMQVKVDGRAALRDWLSRRQAAATRQRIHLDELSRDGRFVSAQARVEGDSVVAQRHTCVFEFDRDGLIRRAWQLPCALLDRAA